MKLQTLKPRVATISNRVQTIQPGSWRTDKRTSAQRGYGYQWQKARAEHLGEHPLCVRCERRGLVTEAMVVDHRIPHRGNQQLFWDRSNWDSLCKPCHDGEKKREEMANETMGTYGQ